MCKLTCRGMGRNGVTEVRRRTRGNLFFSHLRTAGRRASRGPGGRRRPPSDIHPRRMDAPAGAAALPQAAAGQASSSFQLPPCQAAEEPRKMYTPDRLYCIDGSEIGCARRPAARFCSPAPAGAAVRCALLERSQPSERPAERRAQRDGLCTWPALRSPRPIFCAMRSRWPPCCACRLLSAHALVSLPSLVAGCWDRERTASCG